MHLLYCDESNQDERPGEFLIYGGVIIPADRARSLSDAIEALRVEARFPADGRLKFNKPDHMEHEEFKSFKQRIIELAIEHGCKLMIYTVLHDLSGDPDAARRYGINTICYHFYCVLNRYKSTGLVLVDRFNDQGNLIDGHLREKMATGIQLPHEQRPTRLDNIIGFHYSAIGQSHFTSLVDILVGSVRFVFNVHTRRQENLRDGALNLLRILSPLFFREEGRNDVRDLGLTFSPMNVRSARYHAMYTSLQAFLREGGVDSSQKITNIG